MKDKELLRKIGIKLVKLFLAFSLLIHLFYLVSPAIDEFGLETVLLHVAFSITSFVLFDLVEDIYG